MILQREHAANLSNHTPEPLRCFNSIYYDDDDDDDDNDYKENKVIKSSVEDFVPIPSESEDTFGSDSEYNLPSCDDLSPINVPGGKSVTFSSPLFGSNDNFTSSDDESLSDQEVPEDNDECFDPGGDIDEIDAFLDIDISTNIEDGYHDSEGDVLYLESLHSNNTIPNLPPDVFLDRDPRSLSSHIRNVYVLSDYHNPTKISMNVVYYAKQSIFCEIHTINDNNKMFCTFIYDAYGGKERKELWKDLHIHRRIAGNDAWVVLGDMNVTLSPNEHSSESSSMISDMNDFKDCINSLEVEDLESSGLFFTWTNNLFKVKPGDTTGVLKKLDRTMVNEDFLDKYLQAHAIFLPYLISYHNLNIIVIPKVIKPKRKAFKFANFIADKKEFIHVVMLKSRKTKSRINSVRDNKGNIFHNLEVADQFVKHFQEFLGKVVNVHSDEMPRALKKKNEKRRCRGQK
nr:RNA-directed DNA polymerase, eukaryota, reverse transcriptase zinc-binding domain protein [Tanacetum cinerariifolium]